MKTCDSSQEDLYSTL